MTCPQCGHQHAEPTKFCTKCGTTLSPAAPATPTTTADEGSAPGGLTRLLLVGVTLVAVTTLGVTVLLFLLPPPHLQSPDIQPAARVAPLSEFSIGTSRVVTWGERIILVVRRTETAFHAVDGTAEDGCILRWNADALRIESPCTHIVYDLQGNVVAGLTRLPLRRFDVFDSEGVVYVTES